MAAQVNLVIHPPGWIVGDLPILKRTDGVYILFDPKRPIGDKTVKVYASQKHAMRDGGYVVCDRCNTHAFGVESARAKGWSVVRPGGDECPKCLEGMP